MLTRFGCARLSGTVALAMLVTACAGRSQRDATPRADITVDIVNDNFYDARIHALHDGGRRRTLGTIAGNGGRTRKALEWEPRMLIFEVSFIVEGSVYRSLPLDVSPGEAIELRLPPNIDESGFFRRVSRN
ncbi:MAG: hypothetical protein ACREM1_13625 [Longimicrobiales bacterium]